MRAYGTFPHPNVLGAFLVFGLLSCYYLFFQSSEVRPRKIWVVSGIFIILLGLVLTFSRTAWLMAILSSLLTIGYLLLVKSYRKQAMVFSVILFSIFCFLVFSFSPFIFSRAQIAADEPSVSYRLAYNKLGLDLIRENPLGVGIGNQVLYSVRNGVYEKFGMDQVWQWQPIHNIYILIASEIGVLGLLAFLMFLTTILIDNFQENYIFKIMLFSLLIFGMVDHFLWTLQPGRLMLWLVIGILISGKPRP